MLRNETHSWGLLARGLHWSMAVLIPAQLALGKYAEGLGLSPQKLNLMMWHKSIGVVLLLLALIRLSWAFISPRPAPVTPQAGWTQRVSSISHIALYLLMIAIPLSGWLMNSAKNIPFNVFRVLPWPRLIEPDEQLGGLFQLLHEGLTQAFLVLLSIHIFAALWHHFFRKDSVLRRMWFGGAQ